MPGVVDAPDSMGCQGEIMAGWWYTYPSAHFESQLGCLFPIYGKIQFMFQTTNPMAIECIVYPFYRDVSRFSMSILGFKSPTKKNNRNSLRMLASMLGC